MPILYDHGYRDLPVRERILQMRDALNYDDEQFREAIRAWDEIPELPIGDDRVILGPDVRESIRQVQRELALRTVEQAGEPAANRALQVFETLPTWRYVVESGTQADIRLVTVVNDFAVILRLLPAEPLSDPFRIGGAAESDLRVAASPGHVDGEPPSAAQPEPTLKSTGSQNRAAIDEFIRKVRDTTGRKITRTDIWTAANYTNRTDFERYQRDDPRTTDTARAKFSHVLKMQPQEFVEALERKRSSKK
jgi:hypothetical protein